MIETVQSYKPAPFKIAIGYNANLDLIIPALELMEKLSVKPSNPIDWANISSWETFAQTFSYYFSRGSAAERFVIDGDMFDKITHEASLLPEGNYSTGGNAALMANNFAALGCTVNLGGAVGKKLKGLLHPSIRTVDGISPKDEIHLIMEYPKGIQWHNLTSPRANRFIITHDMTNSQVKPLEQFHFSLPHFQPQLVVLAGLHLLESNSEEFQIQRLKQIVLSIKEPRALSSDPPLHLELASVGDLEYLKKLAHTTLPFVDSVGLNEQELFALYQTLEGTAHKKEEFVSPTVETVADAVVHVFNQVTTISMDGIGQRGMNRMHFHSLHFHLIAQRKKNLFPKAFKWSEERARVSVAAASLASGMKACDFPNLQSGKANLEFSKVHLLFPERFVVWGKELVLGDSSVISFETEQLIFFLSPVLVCHSPTKTVGLGDTISSTGLVFSV
eukprot:TRINITY_DN5539_c0_g1_i2.p1 TRINITY_DN5539_c0_g1~~TRINITY_DN5539_c0_g1_i2.p1  ORF type:complete len:498 (-),score=120.56 TRINITY_DN5539_c0_g1_i2:150-1487(-)